MASFTDTLVNFNPYVTQIPVDAYTRVGMMKQEEYTQGVEKVQAYIDSIAGLEVIKPEQKDYLEQRVGQLQNETSKIVQRDFSNQQLVNSVGNLTSKIANDPIIKSAVASTNRYKAGVSAMRAAQEKGESGPSNEWAFQDAFQKWYNDKDVESSFNGEFTKFTDVNKKVLAAIKELEPNSTIEDIPYKRNNDGSVQLDRSGLPIIDYAMMEKSVKGLTPERIEAAIRANLDQNDLRQLSIDGRYTYRGADKVALKQVVDNSYQSRLDQINDTIKGLMVDRQTNISNAAHVSQVDQKIEGLKNLAEKYQNSYKRDIGSLDVDPEGYKSNLYMENYLSRFGSGYAYSQNSLTYKENPFFMAAERRRENDIRYQEFLINKQFQSASLALQYEKLALDKEELEIKRIAAKKKAKEEAGGGLALADVIPDAIDEALVKGINAQSFIAETDAIGEQIDFQKMALLAQVRPDLVGVVRSPEGKVARYEYRVQGKDPNTVKAEAEATILKLKESYDRGETVDDGTKTYFDALGDASQQIDNRKFALGNLNKDADRDVGTITPYLARVKPLVLPNRTSMSPTEQLAFNEKLKAVEKQEYSGAEQGYVTRYDDAQAQKLFTSPAEKLLYSIIRKPLTERIKNPEEMRIVEQARRIEATVSSPARGLMTRRADYLDNAVRDIVGVTQPTAFTIEGFKAEDRNRVAAAARELIGSMQRRGTVGPPLPGSEKLETNFRGKITDAAKMLQNENLPGTSFSLVSKGAGKYAIRLSNNDINTEGQEIPVTPQQARSLFGDEQFLDNFQRIRESLQLSKGTGRVTTDVQGTGKQSAFTLRNSNINNYGVKYHVEDPLKNGGLQLRLFIFDKAAGTWLPDRVVSTGTLLNEAQITQLLSGLTDQSIQEFIEKNK